MSAPGHDTLKTRSTLTVGAKSYAYYSLSKAALVLGDIGRLPFSIMVLLENLVRFEDGPVGIRGSRRVAAPPSDICR